MVQQSISNINPRNLYLYPVPRKRISKPPGAHLDSLVIMKALLYLFSAVTLAFRVNAAVSRRDVEPGPKKDHVEKPIDPLLPGKGATVTTLRYG
jgi:hypothetical protein